MPSVTAVSVDGASNAPGSDPNGADIEVALDIDVIGAAAPSAKQVVYFAPNNGDQGFVDAISQASSATPAPVAISISWGQSEDSWTAQGRSAMDAAIADAAAMGIMVCVASGDNGSGDAVGGGRPHVDFPASSPHALGCGGTKLIASASTGVISSEVVWNETAANEGAGGGGVSDTFALPSFQANAGVPARAASSSAAPAAPAASAASSAAQPGVAQPGVAQPGGAQPGGAQPGVAQPGGAQPGVVGASTHHKHHGHHGHGGGTGSGGGGTGSGGGGTGGVGCLLRPRQPRRHRSPQRPQELIAVRSRETGLPARSGALEARFHVITGAPGAAIS